jgi:ubiquinone/menaquinone biosynthesis C-methylase UbiE
MRTWFIGDIYTHGHHESVLRSHKWRNAENSAGYLLESLDAGQQLLDVGCGPATITLDLAARVAPGSVIGIDAEAQVIAQADELRLQRAAANVSFATGSVYDLDFGDASFDVVHAHQVMHHLRDPVAALTEMRRVLRLDGVLGVRDSDYGAFVWSPADPLLDRWRELYHQVSARNGSDPHAGRHLLEWVRAAGFTDVRAGSSTWTFADNDSRAWWGGLWSDRVRLSSFAEQAVAYGLSDQRELADIADAWLRWSSSPDGFFVVLHGEVLARA